MNKQACLQITPDVAEFYYTEANLLDERHFEAWLALLHENIEYFMPMRRNVKFGQHAERENTRQGSDISWFDEGKWTLTKRVEQILTGVHYAEEPLSRTTHFITNVRVLDIDESDSRARLINTSCNFMVYLNRVEYEVNTLAGKRYDTLISTGDSYQILKRKIILDQNILLVKNLTTFF